jgi:chlorophyll(ide) b reductase
MGLLEAIGAATAVAGLAIWRRQSKALRPDHDTGRGLGVVVTGSTRGLGFALAKEFLACGDSVVINGRSEAAVEAAKRELQPLCTKEGQHVFGLVADVTDAKSCETLATGAQASLGRVDLWINNAGMSQHPKAPLIDTKPAEIESVLSANLHSAIFGCRAALAMMLAQPDGRHSAIFNMDGAGSRGNATPNSVAYGASKAAIPQLGKSLAAETHGTQVSVHTASPGMVITELLLNSANAGPSCTGPADKRALRVINILADQPETTARWLVPRMRGAIGRPSGEYIRYLTGRKAAWRFLTARWRVNRLVEVPTP